MNFPAQMPAAQGPDRLGQQTAVEQSRAVAEVQAAIYVARQFPRDVGRSRAAMQAACGSMALAERAFYRFPRAGGAVEGSTIHLAKTLAQTWGNIQYGVSEMRRDDDYRQSEMQAWAWDVEANTRHVLSFIVPHAKFANKQVQQLVDLRDIYENNANNGARRLREAIFAVIPDFFIDEAEELCRETLNKGDGKPLEQRVEGAVKVFEQLGITADRLEQKLGRPRAQWAGADIAQLLITHKSIQRREIAVDEAFPQARITGAEITSKKNGGRKQQGPPDDDPWAGEPSH
ncbi:hypothetical protein C9F11_37975 [Streptomyces sp. YIM 121038]|uniref:hypothetical protein n=1 Tax=Streptomyces sp. YIM 121038 TaxID=2136401 RepID=UPI0011107D14|nr:hypothetical protein [Streptomyces sp. YIM 121038]QCX81178.1 hypothetical protein C9F11_37975 [Streptomyces sp. YIM 121038]